MQISVSTRHGHLSEASQEKIKTRMEKLTRIWDRLTSIEVTVDLEHEEAPEVHLLVSAEHKHDFTASDKAETLPNALDNVMHKMEQQLRKYKEKVVERSRDSGKRKQELPLSPESAPEQE